MKFCHVTIDVKNMEASLAFYKDIVGLEVRRQFRAGPNMEIAFLGSGETEVELICGKSHDGPGLGNGISFGFVSKSLEDTITLLRKKGYETDGIIQSPNPHMSFFFTRDPDGYNIQFVKGYRS